VPPGFAFIHSQFHSPPPPPLRHTLPLPRSRCAYTAHSAAAAFLRSSAATSATSSSVTRHSRWLLHTHGTAPVFWTTFSARPHFAACPYTCPQMQTNHRGINALTAMTVVTIHFTTSLHAPFFTRHAIRWFTTYHICALFTHATPPHARARAAAARRARTCGRRGPPRRRRGKGTGRTGAGSLAGRAGAGGRATGG